MPTSLTVRLLVSIVSICASLAMGGLAGYRYAKGQDAKSALDAANAAAQAIQKSEESAREAERKHAELLSATAQAYQQKIKETENARDKALADLRSGTRGLYVRAHCPRTGNVPETPTPSGGSDGGTPIRLPDDIAQSLVTFASRCDQVADQLRAAQQVIIDDRKLP